MIERGAYLDCSSIREDELTSYPGEHGQLATARLSVHAGYGEMRCGAYMSNDIHAEILKVRILLVPVAERSDSYTRYRHAEHDAVECTEGVEERAESWVVPRCERGRQRGTATQTGARAHCTDFTACLNSIQRFSTKNTRVASATRRRVGMVWWWWWLHLTGRRGAGNRKTRLLSRPPNPILPGCACRPAYPQARHTPPRSITSGR